MKAIRTIGFAAVASALLIVPPAFAQQQQQHTTTQHVPTTTTGATLQRFPMPAAAYERNVSRTLEMLRKAKPMGPITQADYNKVILMLRDCASNAEADGVVSAKEAQGCHAQVRQFRQEKLREIMTTSTPDQWARWRASLPKDDSDQQ